MSKTSESKIATTLKKFGHDMMAPVIANFDVGNGNKRIRKESMVGQLARRVVKKASFLSTSMRNTHIANLTSVSNSKLLSYNLHHYFNKPICPLFMLRQVT